MDVAIRILKAKLSAYVKRAAAGEIFTVTERGRPVAVLGPLVNSVDLAAAVKAGWVTPPTAKRLSPVRRFPSESSVEQAMAEDRAE